MAVVRPWVGVLVLLSFACCCTPLHSPPADVFDPFGQAALFEGDETFEARWRLSPPRPPAPDAAEQVLADRAVATGLCTRAAALNASSPSLPESTRERNRRALHRLVMERPGLIDSARTQARLLLVPPLVRESLITEPEAEALLRPLNLLVSPVRLAATGTANPPRFQALAGQLLLMAEAETLLVQRRCGPCDAELDTLLAQWKALPTFAQRFQVSLAMEAMPAPHPGEAELARRTKRAVARAQFRRALDDARRSSPD